MSDQLALLQQVNTECNAIPYSAIAKAGQDPDEWIVAPDGGEWECRDYTQDKAEALRQASFPIADLTIVECWIEP